MSSFSGRSYDRGRGGRSRGRTPFRGGSSSTRGRYAAPTGGLVRQVGRGYGGDSITFSVCKFYATGSCNRGNACAHRHAVRRMYEAPVSARHPDGTRGAVRSMLQWKEKRDHVFTACDDGTVKMWSTQDGSTWTQVTSAGFHEWRHVGAMQEVDGALYVGYGMPYAHSPDVTVDAIRVMDLKGGSAEEVVNPAFGFAHSHRINCVAVVYVAGGDARVYTGDDEGRIAAWARPTPGAPFAQLAVLEGHARAITALIYISTNGMLWSASLDATVRIWNVTSNACEHIITKDNGGHTGGVVALAVGQSAAEGTPKDYMISASMDGTMGVFQVLDGAMTYKHKCGIGVTSLAVFDPTPGTSALLLVGYQDGTIAVRNFPEFALAFELHQDSVHVGHTKPVYALLPFNNPAIEDSYFLSAGEEGNMICWNVHRLTDDRPPPGS